MQHDNVRFIFILVTQVDTNISRVTGNDISHDENKHIRVRKCTNKERAMNVIRQCSNYGDMQFVALLRNLSESAFMPQRVYARKMVSKLLVWSMFYIKG